MIIRDVIGFFLHTRAWRGRGRARAREGKGLGAGIPGGAGWWAATAAYRPTGGTIYKQEDETGEIAEWRNGPDQTGGASVVAGLGHACSALYTHELL